MAYGECKEQIIKWAKYCEQGNCASNECPYHKYENCCAYLIKDLLTLTEDVVPRSEVERLQKKLNDYERVVGKLSFTVDGVATLLIGENVEYIDKRVAEGFKNMAVKQAKQEVAREIFEEIADIMYRYAEPNKVVADSIKELKKKYIGE